MLDCLTLSNASGVLLTSSTDQINGYASDSHHAVILERKEDKQMVGAEKDVDDNDFGGLMDGRGQPGGRSWSGLPGAARTARAARPERRVRDLTVEHLPWDSPYWTFLATGVAGLEVRGTKIHASRTSYDGHDVVDLTAFNTDGFDGYAYAQPLNEIDPSWSHDARCARSTGVRPECVDP